MKKTILTLTLISLLFINLTTALLLSAFNKETIDRDTHYLHTYTESKTGYIAQKIYEPKENQTLTIYNLIEGGDIDGRK